MIRIKDKQEIESTAVIIVTGEHHSSTEHTHF